MSGDLRAEILGLRTSQRSVAFADAMHDRALDEVLDLIPEGAVLVTEETLAAALDDPRTECTHSDERGSTVMHVRDDRYECAVCGEAFRLVPAALAAPYEPPKDRQTSPNFGDAARSEPRAEGLREEVERLRQQNHAAAERRDHETAAMRQWIDRHRRDHERAAELVRGTPADWSNDPKAKEPDGWWSYTSQANRDIIVAAVMAAATPPAEGLDVRQERTRIAAAWTDAIETGEVMGIATANSVLLRILAEPYSFPPEQPE